MHRFALAGVVSISGAVVVLASCVGENPAIGSDVDAGAPSNDAALDTGTSSGGPDAAPEASLDASADADAAPTCPRAVTVTRTQLDQDYGWRSAIRSQGACTQTDLTTLQNNLTTVGTSNYLALGNGLSASCVACAITYDSAANWGPIVADQATNGVKGFFNFGACFGDMEGAACGKSLQYEQFCYLIVCGDCTNQAERQKCIETTGQTTCKAFSDGTAADCPNIQTTAKSCNSVADAVKTLCGPTP